MQTSIVTAPPLATRTVSTRYVTTLLSVLGIFTSTVILATVFWLSQQVNAMDRDRVASVVHLSLSQISSTLNSAVRDSAHWTTAFDAVTTRDDASVYDNLGSSAGPNGLFDELLVLSPNGQFLYHFPDIEEHGDPNEVIGLKLLQSGQLDHFISKLKTLPEDTPETVTGAVVDQGVAAFVSLSWILPDDHSLIENTGAPILMGMNTLASTRLKDLEGRTATTGFQLSDFPPNSGNRAQGLHGPSGNLIGYLTWPEPKSGSRLFRHVLPGILVTCMAILLICLSAARHFQAQSHGTARAKAAARTDHLTGLLNRAGLQAILETDDFHEALANNHVAVMYLDLNKFKQLNDTEGHETGDQALIVLSEWLRKSIRRTDYAIRLGGDEFLVLIVDHTPETAARSVSARLLDFSAKPTDIDNKKLRLSASIGIAISEPGNTWEALLQRSDQAMYRAKQMRASETRVYIDKATMPDRGFA